MKRPCFAPQFAFAAVLALGLAACELLVLGSAAGLAYAYVRGEGVRLYDKPYEEVVPAVEKAAGALNLRNQSTSIGRRRTVITGRDVDGNRVRLRVFPQDGGKRAEVRVRIGAMGEYVPTKVFVDTVNELLGLPPDPDPPRSAG